jgi:hypothetical protein
MGEGTALLHDPGRPQSAENPGVFSALQSGPRFNAACPSSPAAAIPKSTTAGTSITGDVVGTIALRSGAPVDIDEGSYASGVLACGRKDADIS